MVVCGGIRVFDDGNIRLLRIKCLKMTFIALNIGMKEAKTDSEYMVVQLP